jgi:hypothetical protein
MLNNLARRLEYEKPAALIEKQGALPSQAKMASAPGFLVCGWMTGTPAALHVPVMGSLHRRYLLTIQGSCAVCAPFSEGHFSGKYRRGRLASQQERIGKEKESIRFAGFGCRNIL